MADVVKSSAQDPPRLAQDFRAAVHWVNIGYRPYIKSPLTITLGDEFQGVIENKSHGLEIIIALEEYIISKSLDFKLRYILHEGEINTPVNRERAYEMLGTGLTDARKQLIQMKKQSSRFRISVAQGDELDKMMKVIEHFINSWHPKDRSTVAGFLAGHSYKAMAKIEQKDDSTLWRRRKSLAIDEYLLCKELLQHLVQ